MLSFKDNPPVLLPGAATLADLTGRWWVGHTKARFEKAFAWDLLNSGIGYFLPMVERAKVVSGKKRRLMMPLFPSYAFFCGSEEDRYKAMCTGRLCQAIPAADQPKLISQLSAVERVVAGKVELDLYPFAVVAARCRVTSGPFVGIEGVVVSRGDKARLVLQVSILGQGAALEIDAEALEPLDDDRGDLLRRAC